MRISDWSSDVCSSDLGTRLSSEDVDLLRVLLDSIAASLPVEMIYSDYSTHPREINQRAVDESQTLERLKSLRKVLYGDGPGDPNAFPQIVRSTHLFDGQIELAEKFISETRSEEHTSELQSLMRSSYAV